MKEQVGFAAARLGSILLAGLIALSSVSAEDAPEFLPPLSSSQIRWANSTLEEMKQEARGPYSRLRWYCSDGSIHPPQGTPCQERGGGIQHAELSGQAKELATLGFNVGTILAALNYEEFLDAPRDYLRLKELVIQQFLFETDDGWIMRRARSYRGARQIEDEQRQGTLFLTRLFSDPSWLDSHYLLATQIVTATPHSGISEAGSRRIRNLALEIAAEKSDFQPIRVRIHSVPSRQDLDAVQSFLERRDLGSSVKAKLTELRDALASQYSDSSFPSRTRELLDELKGNHGVDAMVEELEQIQAALGAGADPPLELLSSLSRRIRQFVCSSREGRLNLLLMDFSEALRQRCLVLAQEQGDRRSRLSRLAEIRELLGLAYGAGFLSAREYEAQVQAIVNLTSERQKNALQFKTSLNYVARSLDWATETSKQTFGPIWRRYQRVEEKANGFFDALLRASVMFPLARRLEVLQRDAYQNLLGATPISEEELVLRGVNPGIAAGRLKVLERVPVDWEPDPSSIYVLRDLEAELRPVAGLIGVGQANLLSHLQLLARGLQIPSASIDQGGLATLDYLNGKEVFLAVSPLGRVVLKELTRLDGIEEALYRDSLATAPQRLSLDTSGIRLDLWKPVPLAGLTSVDSGVIAGPKAANLGQLHALFPGSVPTGLVLPFGLFNRHIDRRYNSQLTVREEIRAAFDEARQMEESGAGEAQVNRFMFDRLDRIRSEIEAMPWIPEDRERIEWGIRSVFGAKLNRGVFIRSDTNVEDLPNFSGAGLNLTIPNQKSVEGILAAIKKLWASPFTERAYLWRQRVLREKGEIYPSVLILESIPSEKSGVLITADLEGGRRDCLTIGTAEGVGGAVQGESVETILACPDGEVRLLSQARAPFRRVLDPGSSGGVAWRPSSGNDFVLEEAEIDELRGLAAAVQERMPGPKETIWDIEFGFAGGRIWLFQIRPVVTYRNERGIQLLRQLDEAFLRADLPQVDLSEEI